MKERDLINWIENNQWLQSDPARRSCDVERERPHELDREQRVAEAVAGGLALVASSTVFLIPWIFRSLQRALAGHDVHQITWMILAFLGVTLQLCRCHENVPHRKEEAVGA